MRGKMDFKDIEAAVFEAKTRLATHNIDKEIPLDVRWTVFVDAPEYLKETEPWTTTLEGMPRDFIGYDGPIYAQRRETIYSSYVVDTLEEDLDEEDFTEQVNMEVLKEGILRRNLGSFTYDW